jgi:hypothetical protein
MDSFEDRISGVLFGLAAGDQIRRPDPDGLDRGGKRP